MAEELVDVLLEIPDEVERAPSVGVVVAVRAAAAVGGGLVRGQQVLLLQSLELGKPLSVLSLAPLPAIQRQAAGFNRDFACHICLCSLV